MLINKRHVEDDWELAAESVAAGHTVAPDRYDYEDEFQFNRRTQKEYEQISEILKKKNIKAWRRWHKIPEPENEAPYNEWEKIPGMRPGTLASNSGGQNVLSSRFGAVPIHNYGTNALNQPFASSFDPNKVRG